MTITTQILVQTIFQPLRYKYAIYPTQKATVHYTTHFSDRTGWRQTSKQMEKWIVEATMEDNTDKEVT
jgi:hypothetical protein